MKSLNEIIKENEREQDPGRFDEELATLSPESLSPDGVVAAAALLREWYESDASTLDEDEQVALLVVVAYAQEASPAPREEAR